MKLRITCAVVLLGLCGVNSGFAQTISGFSPGFGTNGQGFIVITGTGFSPGSLLVKFNNVTASASASSPTQINAFVPSTATTGPISVKVGTGPEVFSQNSFIVIGPQAYITNFPSTASSGTAITIFGVHFTGATAVKFSGTNATFTPPTSDGQIQATVPPNVTTGPISITTSKGTGFSTSNFYGLPVISGFSPANGRVGTNITIIGRNFTDATSVPVNGMNVPGFTINSATNITLTVSTNTTTGKVGVFAPGGGVVTSSNFVVLPTIFGFSPFVGRPGTNVTITGANLLGNPVVKFNGGPNAAIVGTPTANQIVATVPAGTTSGPISVTTTNGTVTSVTNFFIPPSITLFSPTNGATGATVTITGLNFTNATAVHFNGIPAGFVVVNNTSITAMVPAAATSGPISVITPGGTATTTLNFFVPPIVSGFDPGNGVVGNSVTLLGSSFTNATLVKFNGVDATNFTVLNNSQIAVTVPTNATTGPVSVIAPGGTGVSAVAFVVDALVVAIRSLTNSAVALSWPSSATGFVLQANMNLSTTNWVAVTNAPAVVNGKNTVTNEVTNSATFYRLRK